MEPIRLCNNRLSTLLELLFFRVQGQKRPGLSTLTKDQSFTAQLAQRASNPQLADGEHSPSHYQATNQKRQNTKQTPEAGTKTKLKTHTLLHL